MPRGVFVRSAEYREKMRRISLARNARPPSPKGTIWTDERKQKLRLAKQGVPRPPNVRAIMAETQFAPGHTPHNRGRVHLAAEKNPQWRGGTSPAYQRKQATRSKPDHCEVCGAAGSDFKRGLCFDHDHDTGAFRGWLCTRCNVALGMVNDSVERLQALSDYLRVHTPSVTPDDPR
jgi:hypothetical protein